MNSDGDAAKTSGVGHVIELLEFEYNGDFWFDVARAEVADELRALTGGEWAALIEASQSISSSAQVRLAEASVLVDRRETTTVLIALLASDSASVGAAAANSLIEIGYSWDPTESLLDDLHRHLDNAGSVERYPLELLIARLPT